MAQYKFNRTGAERKQLVGAISEILNAPTKYLGMPTAAYEVGGYHIDKEGTVEGEFNLTLFAVLEAKGFDYETDKTYHLITPRGTFLILQHFATAEEAEAEGYGIYFNHEGRDVYIKQNPDGATEHSKLFAVVGSPFAQEAPAAEAPTQDAPQDETPEMAAATAEETDLVSIELPLDGFAPEALDNLAKMVKAKEPLLKKSLDMDDLPIQIEEERICFPWFRLHEDKGEIASYSQFIACLCETAKEKKRVTAKAHETFENEKFALRVWLIGLGMVGKEYSAARKLLVNNRLLGNSAWRFGVPEKAPETAIEAEETEVQGDE
ncbi:MAG: hypothetical protein LBJ12_02420 [Oscillospiraceae bacterium]|jgi:hypothetical protein|nr:hypothetical protein [Oscillospiraceae bacterium]